MSESTDQSRIIYLHGFNSSPDSEKAQQFSTYFYSRSLPQIDLQIPALPFDPAEAIALLENLVKGYASCYLVGSSLGGYYATYLTEKYRLKAALVNPAVAPTKKMGSEYLGMHTNYYTDEEYELTMDHVDYLSTLDVEVLQYPKNYLLLVQTGDQVCDYRLAVEKYASSQQIVQTGGDHGFADFETVLPEIFQFFLQSD